MPKKILIRLVCVILASFSIISAGCKKNHDNDNSSSTQSEDINSYQASSIDSSSSSDSSHPSQNTSSVNTSNSSDNSSPTTTPNTSSEPGDQDNKPTISNFMSVPIMGGGYVTGLIAHPGEQNLFYARTDVGGAYRWDSENTRWIPILDMFGSDKATYYSVQSLNIDPSDTNIIYAAVGKNTKKGEVLRSTDRGNSWTETGFSVKSVKIDGNSDYRWSGERLAVDPNNSSIIYFGTHEDGLWKNTDPSSYGNWTQVPISQVPLQSDSPKIGVTFVAFDKNSGTDQNGATNVIYAGVFGNGETDGVYRSSDAGKTWSLVPSSPKNPIRGVVTPEGILYVTHKGGVAKCTRDGNFESITSNLATVNEYSGICVDPNNSNIVIVAQQNSHSGGRIYRTTDGGQSWKRVDCLRGECPPWWPNTFWFSCTSSLMMDPYNPNHVWYSDWFGIWRTDNINASAPIFNAYVDGLEEVCVATLCSPSSGEAKLFSGLYDVTGFRHTDITNPPQSRFYTEAYMNDTTSYAVFEKDPNIVYRVTQSHSQYIGTGFKSTDNGKTWTRFSPGLPTTYYGGKIAVSSQDPNVLVWTPVKNKALYSTDGGSNWQHCNGIVRDIVDSVWDHSRHQLASNKTGTPIFYIYTPYVGLLRSVNNGKDFEKIEDNGLPSYFAGNYGVKTVPGQDGGVWVYLDKGGLFKSSDAGSSFEKVSNVAVAQVIGFGKKKPGSPYPATVYLFGKLTTDTQPENRLYMSDDMGATWKRINDDSHKAGKLVVLEGDGQVYGKVFFGTSGRGIYYWGPGE